MMLRTGKNAINHFHPTSTRRLRPLLPILTSPTAISSKQPSRSISTTHSTPSPQRPPSPSPKTIFSGIQPTGIPHLGNYLGALQQWVHLQDTAEKDTKLLYSIVDLHAVTMRQDAEVLMGWKREMLGVLVAVGLDPGRCGLFCQSEVLAHDRLMWLLSCTASMGYLERMTQWKSKMSLSEDATAFDGGAKSKLKLGLFSYPVLQAADILIHRATHVPVGEDQAQHLEFARECVTNFNHACGRQILVSPSTILSPAKRIKSLTDPTVKMSKSDPNLASRILITDPPEDIRKNIMSAVTDSDNYVSYNPEKRPGVSNLLTLLFHFLPATPDIQSPSDLGEKYEASGMRLGEFKRLVAENVSNGLEGVRNRYSQVMSEDGGRYLDDIAVKGAKKARESAEETMALIGPAIGTAWKRYDGSYKY